MPTGSLVAALLAVTPANVVVNPGFEQGLTGWSLTQPSLVRTTDTIVHSGSQALEFTMGTFSSTIAFQTFSPPVPGPITRFSFWYRFDDLAVSRLLLEARIEGSPQSFVVPSPAPNQWTFVDLGPRIFDPQARGIRFFASLQGGASATGAKIYLDDVDVVPGAGSLATLALGAAITSRPRRRMTVLNSRT